MTWHAVLRTTALVGTARHPAPAPPDELEVRPPDGLSNEESMLDQAAFADVITRSSRRPPRRDATQLPIPAPADDAPPASGEAAKLLDLLLTQPPVSRELQIRLVADWLELAAGSYRRVPHRLLPAVLALADTARIVAEQLYPAIGTRGRWLLEQTSPEAPSPPPSAAPDWTELNTQNATAHLARLRNTDPAAARELLGRHWDALGARERAAHLATLAANLGPDDEGLLENALDDKAKSVREIAGQLLDRLPGSARAERMAARLRPLVRVKGLLRKQFEMALPPDPDASALRDGIPPNPPAGEPDRLQRLDVIIRGAPLTVWTDASGGGPASALALLGGEPRVIDALLATAILRADLDWVRALLEVRWDVRLVRCLPAGEQELVIRRYLRRGTGEKGSPSQPAALVPLLRDLPTPWSLSLSEDVLERITAKNGGFLATMLAPVLPIAFPGAAAERCRRLLEKTDDDAARRRVLRDVVQYHSFRQSLTEAFS